MPNNSPANKKSSPNNFEDLSRAFSKSIIQFLLIHGGDSYGADVVKGIANKKFQAIGGEESGVKASNIFNSALLRYVNCMSTHLKEGDFESVCNVFKKLTNNFGKDHKNLDLKSITQQLTKTEANVLKDWFQQEVKSNCKMVRDALQNKVFESSKERHERWKMEKMEKKEKVENEEEEEKENDKELGKSPNGKKRSRSSDDDDSDGASPVIKKKQKQIQKSKKEEDENSSDNAAREMARKITKKYPFQDKNYSTLYSFLRSLHDDGGKKSMEVACLNKIVKQLSKNDESSSSYES